MEQEPADQKRFSFLRDIIAVVAITYASLKYFSYGDPPLEIPFGKDLLPLHQALSAEISQWNSLLIWWYGLVAQFVSSPLRIPGISLQLLHTIVCLFSYILFRFSGAGNNLALIFCIGVLYSPTFFEQSPVDILSCIVVVFSVLFALKAPRSVHRYTFLTCGVFLASYASPDLSLLFWILLLVSLFHLLLKFFGEQSLDAQHLHMLIVCVFFSSILIACFNNPTVLALHQQRSVEVFLSSFNPFLAREGVFIQNLDQDRTVFHLAFEHPRALLYYGVTNLQMFAQQLLHVVTIDVSFLKQPLLAKGLFALHLGLYAICCILLLFFSRSPQTPQARSRSSFLWISAIFVFVFEVSLSFFFGSNLTQLLLPSLLILAVISSSFQRLAHEYRIQGSALTTLILVLLLSGLSLKFGKGICPTPYLCLIESQTPISTPLKDLYSTLQGYRFPRSFTLLSPHKGSEIFFKSKAQMKANYKEFGFAAEANVAADYLNQHDIDIVLVDSGLDELLRKDGSMKSYLNPHEFRSKYQYIQVKGTTYHLLARRALFVDLSSVPDPASEEFTDSLSSNLSTD